MSFGPTEPCGLWQSEQETLPSSTGWCDGLPNCVRLSCTASWAACTWWQLVQATSLRSCVLPAQCERLALVWWQLRQLSLRAAGADALAPANTTSGCTSEGLPVWASLSPWQLVHEGVRPSAVVPCRLWPIVSSCGSSWHLVHFASFLSTRS